MDDTGLHEDMVKKDVIWGLSTLAQTGNGEILTLCARALCCLSARFATVKESRQLK